MKVCSRERISMLDRLWLVLFQGGCLIIFLQFQYHISLVDIPTTSQHKCINCKITILNYFWLKQKSILQSWFKNFLGYFFLCQLRPVCIPVYLPLMSVKPDSLAPNLLWLAELPSSLIKYFADSDWHFSQDSELFFHHRYVVQQH